MTTGYIEFSNVWKKFRRGEINDRLRDTIPALASRVIGRTPRDVLSARDFWALRDVSFEVRPGEALGIIGPNGAGKSTILKLLTRILRPTRGQCAVHGRVGALIEVSAGFHPDLTGRENVFLQGAIMGMPKREISRKFDEIVDFSGIAAFMDTPVKRYSSGMEARLGFAVAAHLDPDVLIVDEVLSVGDAAFQRKAVERVRELVRRGMPVVFVSHQLDAVASLCTHAILLQGGTVTHTGTPNECIAAYLAGSVASDQARDGDTAIAIERVRTPGAQPVPSGEFAAIEIACAIREGAWAGSESIGVRVRSCQTGVVAFETGTLGLDAKLPGRGRFSLSVELQMNVPPGVYAVDTFVWDRVATCAAAGPSAVLHVTGGREFRGMVQMNPCVHVTTDVATTPAQSRL